MLLGLVVLPKAIKAAPKTPFQLLKERIRARLMNPHWSRAVFYEESCGGPEVYVAGGGGGGAGQSVQCAPCVKLGQTLIIHSDGSYEIK